MGNVKSCHNKFNLAYLFNCDILRLAMHVIKNIFANYFLLIFSIVSWMYRWIVQIENKIKFSQGFLNPKTSLKLKGHVRNDTKNKMTLIGGHPPL